MQQLSLMSSRLLGSAGKRLPFSHSSPSTPSPLSSTLFARNLFSVPSSTTSVSPVFRPTSSVRSGLCGKGTWRAFCEESNGPVVSAVEKIRNVAIIAHVDHGKTTLVDCLLKQTLAHDSASGERAMDKEVLEKERGITILSKCTGVQWKDFRVNIVDTPGHADFGGEVERVLHMVDGVVLVVDASEGPMPQTKFVLMKALKARLQPVVVFNKVDRPTSRIGEVENEMFDLFVNLEAPDELLDYPVIYASARDGWASLDPTQTTKDMSVLMDTIIKHVPVPKVSPSTDPFTMVVTMLAHDNWLGRLVNGRVQSGKVVVGSKVHAMDLDGNIIETGKITKVLQWRGLAQEEVEVASAGNIVSIAGLSQASVTHTVASEEVNEPIKTTPIDPPTVAILLGINDSPLKGKDGGTELTTAKIKERLDKEKLTNVALSINKSGGDQFEIMGRGELQLGILLETMRREKFELSVSPPRVLFKEENGKKMEPIEEVIVDVDDEFTNVVIQKLTLRKGELREMKQISGKNRLIFQIPSRGLIGFHVEFAADTRGTGVLNHVFVGYEEFKGELEKTRKGSLVSMCDGVTTAYALEALESRGVLFVGPGQPVYEGCVIGEHNRPTDLDVNPTKKKKLTNMRASGNDENIVLTPAKTITLEGAVAYIQDDEMVELTPKNIRLRKKILQKNMRK